MDEVSDGPLEHGGGGLYPCSENVPHSHEEVVVAEAHRLGADLRRVVVLRAALGSQQSIQQVSLHVVTVVRLVGDMSVCLNTHADTHSCYIVRRGLLWN